MTNTKLILLLNSFSIKEIKEFKKLVSSNFFSKGRNYISLLNQILKYRKKGFDKLNYRVLYSKVYPGKKFSIQTLNNRLSELFKLAEEFLIHKTLSENKTEKNKLLLIGYDKMRTDKLFVTQLKKSKQQIDMLPESDYRQLSIIALENLRINHSKKYKISECTFREYFSHSQFLAGVFLKNLFTFGIEFIQQEQSNRKYESNLAVEILNRLKLDDDFINELEKTESNLYRLVVLMYCFYNSFKNPSSEKYYFEAKKIFSGLKDNIEKNELIDMYKLMTSYCILRINQGVKKFQNELFGLYIEKLKSDCYLDGNKIFPVTTFRNYVLVGIKLKKIKWTEDFIKKYSHQLPEENREDEVNLSYSKLFFSNKDYEKSLQYLSGFKGLNYLHYCDSSILKLCTFYETEKYEEAFFEMDKFRHFIRNHKEIPKIHREYVLNFLKIYQILLKTKTGTGKDELINASELIKKIKPVSREIWLLEKIEELK